MTASPASRRQAFPSSLQTRANHVGMELNSLKESLECVGKLVVKVPRLPGRLGEVLNLPEAVAAFGTFLTL